MILIMIFTTQGCGCSSSSFLSSFHQAPPCHALLIAVDDVQDVQKLALVLMDALDLNVDERILPMFPCRPITLQLTCR